MDDWSHCPDLTSAAAPNAPWRGADDPAIGTEIFNAPLYGACSAEIYRAAGSLNAAHGDAGGFLDHVDQFATPEYWRRDASVKAAIYAGQSERADMDAVRVFYHAGHGAMDCAGQFRLPMGAQSTALDGCISGAMMRLGADRLRYLFWSASESLCVGEGHDPARSWAPVNRGLRMMFGFDGGAWDSGHHGANFWTNWQMGKSFSQAWLDGAGQVSQDQVPVACAMGATPDEAFARLYGERRFHPAPAGRDCWVWRWSNPLTHHRREPLQTIPASFSNVRLVPVQADWALSNAVLDATGLDPQEPLGVGGVQEAARPGLRFIRIASGAVLLEFGRTMRGNCRKVPLHRRSLVAHAMAALRRHGFLEAGHQLCFDRISLAMSAGACPQGRPQDLPPLVDEISVQFRQMIKGVPVISPMGGHVRVVMRPDGGLLRIEAWLRQIASLRPAVIRAALDQEAQPDIAQRLALRAARLMRDLAGRGAAPLGLSVLPGLTEIGYGIRSNTARLVAREAIEVRCMRGFRKRYWIQSDLGD